METRKTTKPYPVELRERAVRLVREQAAEQVSQWSAIRSIADKVGCNAETLRLWVRRSERDRGSRPGLTTDERDRLKALERENRELRQANEILRKASAYFAQAEFDRRRGGSVCLNTVWGVSKWLRRPFQAAAGIGVARLMYAWSGVFPPSDECGLLPL